MKKTIRHFGVICFTILILVSALSAQTRQASHPIDSTNSNPPVSPNTTEAKPTGEMELLRHRVEEVERQNKELMQVVNELKARLDASVSPGDAKASPVV